MSTLSDRLLVVAILGYLTAMLCAAAEYAFGARGVVGRAARSPARALVPAGAPASSGDL
ncbi:MAG TPA: c-type cytochrome biogenesis protein CcsB, partial [Micromonosporaceae bacterium]|nr:c-type cytochrome biogenesis protein CcsB [Micromonosporaceae bacterium]